MPLNAARSSHRGRPPLGEGLDTGTSGSRSYQSFWLIKALFIYSWTSSRCTKFRVLLVALRKLELEKIFGRPSGS